MLSDSSATTSGELGSWGSVVTHHSVHTLNGSILALVLAAPLKPAEVHGNTRHGHAISGVVSSAHWVHANWLPSDDKLA